jgi:glyceraldehyde 3-phosphate dehydrogenase
MALKVGINGFGRIGRLCTRMLSEGYPGLELVQINARADTEPLAHLLKYDSVHRTFAGSVDYEGDDLIVEGDRVRITRAPSPAEIPWSDHGVELVLETTGKFKDRAKAQGHLQGGVKKVVVSAPGKDLDGMFVLGVNHHDYDPDKHHMVSNASCTTNCLAPVAKVLHESFGFEHGLMTTIHAYTMSQRILDGSSKDIRRARAAAMSIIPTSTGAARAVTQVLPELTGKLDGFAIRVPTPDVSMVDLTCRLGRAAGVDEVNGALMEAAQGPLKGIMAVTKEPLVSVDYTGSTYSSVVDAPLTMAMEERMVKVLAWYDNEAGYAARVLDLAAMMASKI